MKRRPLGDSGIEVSEIALGSWLTYSGGVEREQTEACTRAAFDAGINFFDTANAYGLGASETAWGEILTDFPREEFVLATKVYFPMAGFPMGRINRGLSARQIAKQLDASLKRLRTDYVDLYQCHRFDVDTPIEETMEALTRAVKSGKARAIGFSEWTPEQIKAGLDVPGATKFVSSQPQYNAIWRAPEAEVFPLCAQHGISHIVWSPLAQGVLTGKYAPGAPPPADSRGGSDELGHHVAPYLREDLLTAVARLQEIADAAGLTMVQLALAWVLRRSEVASAIVGASRPEQVAQNASASGVALSADALAAIDEALGDHVISGQRLGPDAVQGVKHR